jgi:hypothetical protein
MSSRQQDTAARKLCSLPVCGAMADWYTDFFGETEYYCDRHKPMIPQSLLKRVEGPGTGSLVQK